MQIYDKLVTRVDEELSRLGNDHLKTVNDFTARDLVRPGDKTIAAAGQTVDTVTVGRALGLGRDSQRTLQVYHLLKPWRQHWRQHRQTLTVSTLQLEALFNLNQVLLNFAA